MNWERLPTYNASVTETLTDGCLLFDAISVPYGKEMRGRTGCRTEKQAETREAEHHLENISRPKVSLPADVTLVWPPFHPVEALQEANAGQGCAFGGSRAQE